MDRRWISFFTVLIFAASVSAQSAHFHHVHLNVVDPASTIEFYRNFFGAVQVMYRGKAPALFTERSFILMDQVDERAPSSMDSALWHIGWSGIDGSSEFEWRKDAGIDVHTPASPLGTETFMYFYGPDRELVEVFTGQRNHRFEHLHVNSSSLEETIDWFAKHLGLKADGEPEEFFGTRMNYLLLDNINITSFQAINPDERPDYLPKVTRPQRGTVIDHIAFSYQDIDPVQARMEYDIPGTSAIGIDQRYGIRRFFVPGPDGLNIEIVEEKPIPEGIWE
jgi:catechol 2,3-dioxygenase-like lactoylglutathione lyase family enzyme